MKKAIPLLLHFFSILDGLLLAYPVIVIMEVALLGRLSTGESAIRLLIALAAGALGCLIGWLLDRMQRQPPRIVVLLMAAIPLAGFLAGYLYLANITLVNVLMAAILVLSYILGVFFATHPFDEIVGTSFLSFTMIAFFVAAVVLWSSSFFFHKDCDPALLTGVFLVFMLLYAIISNQSNINRMMGRRNLDLSMLPAGMRWFNLLLVCGGFLLVLLGLVFQKQIMVILQFMLELLGSALYIFVLLYQLFTWYIRKNLYITDEDPVLPAVNNMPILNGEESESVSIVNAITIWVGFALVLLVLFMLRGMIWEGIKTAASTVWKFVKALFAPRQRGVQVKTSVTGYFSDVVEELERDPDAETADDKPVSTPRSWKKRYRDFLKLPQDGDALREGYRLILQWLQIRGMSLAPSDTTLDILNKALVRLPQSPFAQVTDGYNNVRYAEAPLREGDFQSLLDTLAVLASSK